MYDNDNNNELMQLLTMILDCWLEVSWVLVVQCASMYYDQVYKMNKNNRRKRVNKSDGKVSTEWMNSPEGSESGES